MKKINLLFIVAFVLLGGSSSLAQTEPNSSKPNYDAALAKKLGADEYGMKFYVLVILKTGPKDADFKGKERDDLFAGHLANIRRLSDEGKLALAGPFGKNDKGFRGLFIFNVTTIDEAQKFVDTDPTVKAGILVPDMTLWYGSAAMMQINETHKKIASKSP